MHPAPHPRRGGANGGWDGADKPRCERNTEILRFAQNDLGVKVRAKLPPELLSSLQLAHHSLLRLHAATAAHGLEHF